MLLSFGLVLFLFELFGLILLMSFKHLKRKNLFKELGIMFDKPKLILE